MPTEPSLENNQSNYKKLYIILTLLLLFIFLFAAILLINFLPKNSAIPSNSSFSNDNSSTSKQVPRPDEVAGKTNFPEILAGKVMSVDQDRISIKKFSSSDPANIINKSDLNQIVVLVPNPDFDKDKADAAAQAWQEKKSNSNSNHIPSPIISDSTLQPYMQKILDG